jgi:hypothetical protein
MVKYIINGPKPEILNRPYIAKMLEIANKVGHREFVKLLSLRQRLAGPGNGNGRCEQHEQDQSALLAMKSAGVLSAKEFRSLPSSGSPDMSFLSKAFV